jgi:UDP-N-acetylglucosamine 2-epimerase (non-hydrolysing)
VRRVLVTIGTRPEAVKLASVIRALRESAGFDGTVAALGQHRELLSQTLASLGIVPDEVREVMDEGQPLAQVTSRVLALLPPILAASRPDVVLVAGDTNTAVAAALAAFYERVPLAHVEAGLRTGRRDAPFPEEVNRVLITQLASLHFAPTPANRRNLLREGVAAEAIIVTGNPVIDSLRWTTEQPFQPPAHLAAIYEDPRPLLLVTAHRRESWGAPMRAIGRALVHLAAHHPDWHIVCCLHPNPAVRQALVSRSTITYVDPMPYRCFVRLVERASLVMTDSGGLQEEAPALGVPVLVVRDTTERVEAVAAGSAVLAGTSTSAIVAEARRLMRDEAARRRMEARAYQYGDGHAARRIVLGLQCFLDGNGRRGLGTDAVAQFVGVSSVRPPM